MCICVWESYKYICVCTCVHINVSADSGVPFCSWWSCGPNSTEYHTNKGTDDPRWLPELTSFSRGESASQYQVYLDKLHMDIHSTFTISAYRCDGKPSSMTLLAAFVVTFDSSTQVVLYPVSQWADLLPFLGHHLARYSEEHGPLPLVLSTEVIKHIAKLHRALKFQR